MPARVLALLAATVLGCATTEVGNESASFSGSAKPQRIFVYAFSTSPDEVRPDHTVTATVAWKHEGLTQSQEERKVAHDVADKLAERLIEKLHGMGLPAQRGQDLAGPRPLLRGSGLDRGAEPLSR